MTEGFIELRGILSGSKSYGQETLVVGKRDESDYGTLHEETLTYLEDNSWKEEIADFADAVLKGNGIKEGNSSDAISTMRLVYRIYHADRDWREKFKIENPDEH